jgi:isoleucyl-tRNA synthetase
VRQPLAELVVDVPTIEERGYIESITPQLLDELNVKAVRDASEIGGLIKHVIKPNLRILGPKYGKDLGRIRSALDEIDGSTVAAAVAAEETIEVAGFTLGHDEVLVETTAPDAYTVASEGGYSAGVSMEITAELLAEGTVRDMIRELQNRRKAEGGEIDARIRVTIQDMPDVIQAIELHLEYFKQELLADQVTLKVTNDPSRVASSIGWIHSGPM